MHHQAPKITRKGKDIKFSERTFANKVARILYKIIRTFFVGVIYYFVPFTVFFIQFTFEKKPTGYDSGH